MKDLIKLYAMWIAIGAFIGFLLGSACVGGLAAIPPPNHHQDNHGSSSDQ